MPTLKLTWVDKGGGVFDAIHDGQTVRVYPRQLSGAKTVWHYRLPGADMSDLERFETPGSAQYAAERALDLHGDLPE